MLFLGMPVHCPVQAGSHWSSRSQHRKLWWALGGYAQTELTHMLMGARVRLCKRWWILIREEGREGQRVLEAWSLRVSTLRLGSQPCTQVSSPNTAAREEALAAFLPLYVSEETEAQRVCACLGASEFLDHCTVMLCHRSAIHGRTQEMLVRVPRFTCSSEVDSGGMKSHEAGPGVKERWHTFGFGLYEFVE